MIVRLQTYRSLLPRTAAISLQLNHAELLSLKRHPQFSEKWLQDCICKNPSILGLGDVDVVAVEKSLPRAGRLDVLLHDEQLSRRYEVELMLGKTDPNHIIRCIEYWDVERRRYPAYDHVAVLVAEDITSRFLNVMALLAGSIPLIAIRLSALRVNDQIVLHFTHVLDQMELRSDDAYELGERTPANESGTDRMWWEAKVGSVILGICDEIHRMTEEISRQSHRVLYRKRVIAFLSEEDGSRAVWCAPMKTKVALGVYVADPASWCSRLENLGISVSVKRRNRAVKLSMSPEQFSESKAELKALIRAGFSSEAEV